MRLRPSILAVLSTAAAACGGSQDYALVGTPDVDSVYGSLQVEEAEGGSSVLTVELDELPPPARVCAECTGYVVWVAPLGDEEAEVPADRAGAITYDAEARQGRLSTTTPHHRFVLTVTAEPTAEPEAPSDRIVAEQRVTRE
jgi:hypothetical protein